MTARTDSSLAALLLTQRLLDTPAAPLKSSEYWSLLEAVGDPAELLGRSASDIREVADVDAEWPARGDPARRGDLVRDPSR